MQLDNSSPDIKIDGSKLKINCIVPYFNQDLGLALFENVKAELEKHQVKDIALTRVSGALEVPFACKKLIDNQKPDIIITLGAIIRGETSHYDLVTDITYKGLMDLQLETGTPIIFGILTCENLQQALDRVDKNKLNKGKQIAEAALVQSQFL